MPISPELIRGTVVPIVLALLKDRPMYGYEIVKVVNARSNGLFEWREGTLYPTLHKLEADGFLTAQWREAPVGSEGDAGRQRKYYVITRRGTAELQRRAGEWKAFSLAMGNLLREA